MKVSIFQKWLFYLCTGGAVAIPHTISAVPINLGRELSTTALANLDSADTDSEITGRGTGALVGFPDFWLGMLTLEAPLDGHEILVLHWGGRGQGGIGHLDPNGLRWHIPEEPQHAVSDNDNQAVPVPDTGTTLTLMGLVLGAIAAGRKLASSR